MQRMKRFTVRVMCLLSALASVPLAFAQGDTSPPLDDAQIAKALLAADATGRLIYLHDHAAAVATDAVMELKAFRRDGKRGDLAGWITEQREEGIVVSFLSSEPVPRARYRATVASDGRIAGTAEALAEPAALTAYELGAARARTTAGAATFEPCSRTYNTVILPPTTEGGGWTAYLLPGTTQHGVVPLGGSYRLDLDAAGETILKQRPFTRTCIALDSPPNDGSMKAVAMMITHLLDPVPTEVHVFWSLWARQPMYVATSQGNWLIEDGKTRLMSRREKEAQ
jgi:hypothetical protein